MLEVLVVLCVGLSFLILRVTYQVGAKSAAAEIAAYFRREIR
jgi:hypothetical protein